jgi:S-adenosylmethionine-diacylgycerolhomoserine-N-methlytransferase
MGLWDDMKVLYEVNFKSIRGDTHAERLDSFYAPQAALYDGFREKFLHGRREMVTKLPLEAGSVWIDFGCGTGSNLEYVAEKVPTLQQVYLVDLSAALLDIARKRIESHGWTNVSIVREDVSRWLLAENSADVATFSYSLTMIPDWFQALSQARRMLKTGGAIGVADFYIARKYPDPGRAKHPRWLKSWWQYFFARDNVMLNADHLPFLERHFETVSVEERQRTIPYIPFPKVPYYSFIGRKSERMSAGT